MSVTCKLGIFFSFICYFSHDFLFECLIQAVFLKFHNSLHLSLTFSQHFPDIWTSFHFCLSPLICFLPSPFSSSFSHFRLFLPHHSFHIFFDPCIDTWSSIDRSLKSIIEIFTCLDITIHIFDPFFHLTFYPIPLSISFDSMEQPSFYPFRFNGAEKWSDTFVSHNTMRP